MNNRRIVGAIALVAALLVFFAAYAFSSSPAYGASMAKAAKKPKKKPKVLAFVFRNQLNVIGTNRNDRITLRLKPGNPSRLQVDTNHKRYVEYSFKRSRFNRIVVLARSGHDALSIDESYGVFTDSEATYLFGNSGRDLAYVKGLNAAESFDFAADGPRLRFARNGNRVRIAGVERFDLPARGGADNIVVNDLSRTGLDRLNVDLGRGDSDVVNVKGSSAANELRIRNAIEVSGIGALLRISRAEAANDKLNVDPGAGSDRVTVEGTAGNDAMSVAASAVAGHISVTGGPAGVPIDLVNSEALAIEALAGNDTLNAGLGLAPLTQLTLDGGSGNDTIAGGDGNDTLRGGTENDSIDGNRGDDTGLLGAGDDSFTWDPGDGSDKVEGEAGTDTMVFNGAAVAENFDFSANGNRLKFFRNVANITMDVDDTERVDLRALGGIDNTVVNDLSATDVRNIDLDLATDAAVDTTTVNGTAGNDSILIAPNAGAVDVTGLAAALKIKGSEAANDLLNVNGLAGNDTINGSVGLAALIKVGMDGGPGNDALNGGDGVEVLLGGDGNDAIDGNQGNDVGFLGADNDSFRWDPGDGSDVVEGQAGIDTMVFNGAAGAEVFDFSANGSRLRFFRNLGNITMDVDDTEQVDLRTLGGADTTDRQRPERHRRDEGQHRSGRGDRRYDRRRRCRLDHDQRHQRSRQRRTGRQRGRRRRDRALHGRGDQPLRGRERHAPDQHTGRERRRRRRCRRQRAHPADHRPRHGRVAPLPLQHDGAPSGAPSRAAAGLAFYAAGVGSCSVASRAKRLISSAREMSSFR